MQMRIVLSIAAMRLDDHDVATLKGAATDQAEDVIQALHSTAHEGQCSTHICLKQLQADRDSAVTPPHRFGVLGCMW
jgi:hypothetical protein